MNQREEIRAHLIEQGYQETPVSEHDKCFARWRKGPLDVQEWRFDDLRPGMPDAYQVVAAFQTALGWLDMKFYSIVPTDLLARLPEMEAQLGQFRAALALTEIKPGSLITVKWRDAARKEGAWHDIGTAQTFEPLTAYSVGFLVKLTDQHVTICQSVHEEEAGGLFTIPREWAQEIEVIQGP